MTIIVKVGETAKLNILGVGAMRAITFDDLQIIANNATSDGVAGIIVVEDCAGAVSEAGAMEVLSTLKQAGWQVVFYDDNDCISDNQVEQLGAKLFRDERSTQEYLSEQTSVNLVTEFGAGWAPEDNKTAGDVEPVAGVESKSAQDGPESTEGRPESAQDRPEGAEVESEPVAEVKQDEQGSSEPSAQGMTANEQLSGNEWLLKVVGGNTDKAEGAQAIGQADLARMLAEAISEKEKAEHDREVADDRIEVMREMQESLSVELATCKSLLSGVVLGDTLHPEDYSPQYYSDLATQFNDILERRRQLKEEHDSAVDKLVKQEAAISELKASIEKQAAEKSDLEDEKLTLQEKYDALVVEKEGLEAKIEELEGKLAELTEEHEKYNEETFNELQSRLEELGAKVGELASQLTEASDNNSKQADSIQKSQEAYENEVQANQEKNLKISELEALVKNLQDSLDSSGVKIQQLEVKVAEGDQKLVEIENETDSRIKEATEELQGENSELTDRATELEAELAEKETKLQGATFELAELKAKLEGLEKLGVSSEMQQGELDMLRAENQELSDTKVELEGQLRELRSELERANRSAGMALGGSESADIHFKYTGRAKIIPVFGSGSNGITTIAMTIAYGIPGARILYMDLDLGNPAADAWFKKQPLARLNDIEDPLMRSGLGALVAKGAQYVLRHDRELLVLAAQAGKNHGPIDYFSGAYTTLKLSELAGADFETLLNFCGSKYDYIVAEFGDICGSEVSSGLARAFCDNAKNWVVVTRNDKFEARNIKVKMDKAGISRDRAIWAMNFSDTTAVDGVVKQAMGRATPMIIPRDFKLFGTRRPFWASTALRDYGRRLVEYVK